MTVFPCKVSRMFFPCKVSRNLICWDIIKHKFYIKFDLLSFHQTQILHLLQEIHENQIYIVELNRGNRGFGFSIRGGQEFNNMPLFVLRIAEGGVADMEGSLRVSSDLFFVCLEYSTSGIFLSLTSEACEKSNQWLWKESFVRTSVRKAENTCASPTAMIWPKLIKWR